MGQRPHPDNRVVLTSDHDPLGVPQVQITWRWLQQQRAALERPRSARAETPVNSGLGSIEVDRELPLDPHAHHHAGSTRMHRDQDRSVVDPDCRVHGTDKLYAAGSSVFPSARFANPTLIVVALAIRLGEYLAERL